MRKMSLILAELIAMIVIIFAMTIRPMATVEAAPPKNPVTGPGATLPVQKVTKAPPEIPAPFYGPYRGAFSTAQSLNDGIEWYDHTGSDQHKDFGTFDDKNAYDFNLPNNLETNLPAVAPGSGKVIEWGTTFPGTAGGGVYGALMVDCGDWCFSIMHCEGISLKKGDSVLEGQTLGAISKKSKDAIGVHFHFSVYNKVFDPKKINTVSKLVSVKVALKTRDFSISMPSSATLEKGKQGRLNSVVPFFNGKYQIGDKYYVASTSWKSSDTKVATVDGNGLVTAVAAGKATVTVVISGRRFGYPLTVTNPPAKKK